MLFENGLLVFSSRKSIRVKDSDLLFTSETLKSPSSYSLCISGKSSIFWQRSSWRTWCTCHFIFFFWSLQERLGLTTVGPGGERTHVQGPEVNADFLVIIFKIVKYHWACSLRCRLSGHWMDPGERYSPHMKLILRVHCHLSQKRKLNRRKRDPRRNQDDRILEHRIKPQKCKKNF